MTMKKVSINSLYIHIIDNETKVRVVRYNASSDKVGYRQNKKEAQACVRHENLAKMQPSPHR